LARRREVGDPHLTVCSIYDRCIIAHIHYDRWGYLPEKRQAMETWTTWLERVPTASELNA